MLVSDLMTKNVVTASSSCSAAEASRLLHVHNIGALPVVDTQGALRGIVTDRDIVTRCVATESDPVTTPLRELMTRRVTTVSPDDTLDEAAAQMAARQVRRLPVVSHGRLVGMLALADFAAEGLGESTLNAVSRPRL
ncbi:MAG: CBS domain-containing protein [Clostridiaceae bacterium]|nr:CBS domain-containing protein [Clostridiales bacterium]MDD6877117.1 CBS domain-containing protein [Clostridiaceae bacterium]